MKHLSLLAALSLAVLFTSGCSSVPTDTQLNTLRVVASEAAYVGTALRLENEPDSRAQFGVAMSALDVLIRQRDYTPGALQEALKALPVLAGSQGAIVESGAVLFSVLAGFIHIDSAPRVQAVAEGILAGMERAMSRPSGAATRSLAPALPEPCVVPPLP